MSIFGSLLFAILMIVRVEQMTRSGFDLLLFLLAKQAGLAAIRMIFRQAALKETHLTFQVIAWCSAMLPLLMQTVKGLHGLLAVPGLLLSLWAMWSLGSSFSIAPAVRQLVVHGPYRWIRHPM